MSKETDNLAKQSVLFQIEVIREQVKNAIFNDQLKLLCECTEILSRAYRNIAEKEGVSDDSTN